MPLLSKAITVSWEGSDGDELCSLAVVSSAFNVLFKLQRGVFLRRCNNISLGVPHLGLLLLDAWPVARLSVFLLLDTCCPCGDVLRGTAGIA